MVNRSYLSMKNNAQGRIFENQILKACAGYDVYNRAFIEKTPENFITTKKKEAGKFEGRFIKHAQPDFKGTMDGGRAIVFEAKCTRTDKLKFTVLTLAQEEALNKHYKLGAITAICIAIQDEFFFVPYELWMINKSTRAKKHAYFTSEDLKPYKVKFNGAVNFLDFINGKSVEKRISLFCKEEYLCLANSVKRYE